uniref:7TM_GPCR_Srx domain-containing protein n=1 Tax=Caenorhabditis tropicalis TaxID=1561998 RepID=A0A1I7URS9_9PELO
MVIQQRPIQDNAVISINKISTVNQTVNGISALIGYVPSGTSAKRKDKRNDLSSQSIDSSRLMRYIPSGTLRMVRKIIVIWNTWNCTRLVIYYGPRTLTLHFLSCFL